MDPYALASLLRYFDVIHSPFCAVPLQVEHTYSLLSLVEYYLCNLLLVSCVSLHNKSVQVKSSLRLDFGFHFVK